MKYWCHLYSITVAGGVCKAQEKCVEHETFMQYCSTNRRLECPHYVEEEEAKATMESDEEENNRLLDKLMCYDIRC